MPRSANSVPASIRPSINASLWMPATRCISRSGLAAPSHSALTSATPHRRARPWRCPDDQPDADQHHDPVAQYGGDDVLSGQRGDAATDPEEQRAVGRGSFAPQARHRQREDVIEAQSRRRTDAVGIESEPGDLALRQVRVDVLAVHRRRHQQRQDPQHQGAIELTARQPSVAEREAAQHQPGQRHHHRARGGHRQRHRLDARREVEQPDPERRVLHDGPGARAECADGHQDRAGGAEQPGSPQCDEFGVVQWRTHSSLVAVPTGDRRTQRALAGGHVLQRNRRSFTARSLLRHRCDDRDTRC